MSIIINSVDDDLVQANKALKRKNNHRLFWDGYTLVEFIPSKRAERDPDGIFNEGEYGFAKRIEISNDGNWVV